MLPGPGTLIFLFGCMFNILFYPDAAIGTLIMTGEWKPRDFIVRLKYSDALQMIGLGLIILSIIHYFLTINQGYKKPVGPGRL